MKIAVWLHITWTWVPNHAGSEQKNLGQLLKPNRLNTLRVFSCAWHTSSGLAAWRIANCLTRRCCSPDSHIRTFFSYAYCLLPIAWHVLSHRIAYGYCRINAWICVTSVVYTSRLTLKAFTEIFQFNTSRPQTPDWHCTLKHLHGSLVAFTC